MILYDGVEAIDKAAQLRDAGVFIYAEQRIGVEAEEPRVCRALVSADGPLILVSDHGAAVILAFGRDGA